MQFQSTHLHGVRHFPSNWRQNSFLISIHAPTRGATEAAEALLKATYISIHAPTRGATHSIWANTGKTTDFNPRTYTGCDIGVFLYI